MSSDAVGTAVEWRDGLRSGIYLIRYLRQYSVARRMVATVIPHWAGSETATVYAGKMTDSFFRARDGGDGARECARSRVRSEPL